MLMTLQDIAEIKKEITTIESSLAIATDCIDRGMEALSHLRKAALRGDAAAFYISAGDKGSVSEHAALNSDEIDDTFKATMEEVRSRHQTQNADK